MLCGDERNIYECLGCGDTLDPSQFYATPMTHLEMQTHVLATSDRPLYVAVMNRDVSHGGITRDGGAETRCPSCHHAILKVNEVRRGGPACDAMICLCGTHFCFFCFEQRHRLRQIQRAPPRHRSLRSMALLEHNFLKYEKQFWNF
jgi:hypothetical protein